MYICPWGEFGAFGLQSTSPEEIYASATRVPKVVDSTGAGDTFIAACIAALVNGNMSYHEVIVHGCRVAGTKVAQHGYDGLRDAYYNM